jgi:suppressor of G2 allele of SKP1
VIRKENNLNGTMAEHKYQFFQTDESVTVEVLCKGLGESDAHVHIDQQELRVNIPSKSYKLDLTLAGTVDPQRSSWKVTPFKVEAKLRKLSLGNWSALEQSKATQGSGQENAHSEVSQFPSSFSKGKNTNWEQIEREAEKEEEENLTGDAKLNKLFQQIYRDADEDTRRAMEKSYIESNGTSLSTNWEEVKQGKVETKPPDGTPIGYLWHALALFSMSV